MRRTLLWFAGYFLAALLLGLAFHNVIVGVLTFCALVPLYAFVGRKTVAAMPGAPGAVPAPPPGPPRRAPGKGGPALLKSWILFLCFFETAMLLAIFYEDTSISFLALYAMLLLFLCAAVCALCAKRSIRVVQRMDKNMLSKGEPLQLHAVVRNRSPFFYPRIRFEFYGGSRVQYRVESTALRPFSSTELGCTVSFPYRGVYEMGVRRVVVTDFLGLFRVKLPECPPLETIVYPSSDPSFRIRMSDEMQNTDRQSFFAQDYTDVADVRKHTESDTFRHVHWKLSSKRGEFIVKNYQSKAQSKALLLLDARAMSLPETPRIHLEDRVVSHVAAAAEHCLRRQIPAQLLWGIGEMESLPISRDRGLRGCWRTLAALRFGAESSFFPAVPDWLDTSVPAFHMLCFLLGIDPATYAALNRLASGEHHIYVYHFYLPERPPTGEELQMLGALRNRGVSVTSFDASR